MGLTPCGASHDNAPKNTQRRRGGPLSLSVVPWLAPTHTILYFFPKFQKNKSLIFMDKMRLLQRTVRSWYEGD